MKKKFTKKWTPLQDECSWKQPSATKKDTKIYWEKVAAFKDIPFKCAFNMKETHTIGGNIFDGAHKALDGCEFTKMRTKIDGDCGFDAVLMAALSCSEFIESRYIHGKLSDNPPTTVTGLRERCATYLARDASRDLLEEARSRWLDCALDCETGKIPNRDYMGNLILDEDESGKPKKKKTRVKRRKRKKGERMELSDEVRASLKETGQEGFDDAMQFTTCGMFATMAATIDDLLSDDQSKKEEGEKTMIKCMKWKPCWMDEIFAGIIEILFGFKILVVMNVDRSDKDIFEGYHAAKKGEAGTGREFWPYTEFVRGSDAIYDYFIILDSHCGGHFEVYFSNFYEKGIFTWEELVASPTLSVIFRGFIESESKRRNKRDEEIERAEEKKDAESKEIKQAKEKKVGECKKLSTDSTEVPTGAATGEPTGEAKTIEI